MSTQFYVSGPAFTWVGLGSGGSSDNPAWLYLGYTEDGLEVELSVEYDPIKTDYAGNMPAAQSIQGESISVSGTFTRYDENVMQKVVSWKGPYGIAGQSTSNNFLGSLVYEENISYPVLIYSPYSFKPYYNGTAPNSGSPMIQGFWIYNGIHGDRNSRKLGIKRTAPNASFTGLPVFGTYINGTFNPGVEPFNGYALYSNVMPNPLPLTT